VGAVIAVTAVVWGWVVGQFPAIVPPALTIATSKAPETVLWAMTWGIAAGAVLLIPSLAYLFYLFKGTRSDLA
jgi:cytochrome d ubiquinol oxidase subunit II